MFRRLIVVVALTLGFAAVPRPAAAALTGCSTWAIYDSSTGRAGRAGHCTGWTGSGFRYWALAVRCTNGTTYTTGWHPATQISYGIYCPYPRIVDTYWFNYTTG